MAHRGGRDRWVASKLAFERTRKMSGMMETNALRDLLDQVVPGEEPARLVHLELPKHYSGRGSECCMKAAAQMAGCHTDELRQGRNPIPSHSGSLLPIRYSIQTTAHSFEWFEFRQRWYPQSNCGLEGRI